MNDKEPMAFFLTWVTYGTWLPGDERGWVEYKQGWQLPCAPLRWDCEQRMSEDAVRLSFKQRQVVERQVAETCEKRNWLLHTVNCRTNHLHAVITAPRTRPKKIRIDLKAYATRALKAFDPKRKRWWAEGGSIRWVHTADDLESVIAYVNDAQD